RVLRHSMHLVPRQHMPTRSPQVSYGRAVPKVDRQSDETWETGNTTAATTAQGIARSRPNPAEGPGESQAPANPADLPRAPEPANPTTDAPLQRPDAPTMELRQDDPGDADKKKEDALPPNIPFPAPHLPSMPAAAQ